MEVWLITKNRAFSAEGGGGFNAANLETKEKRGSRRGDT